MNKKKTFLIILLILVVLLGGSSVLYAQLSQTAAPDQLVVQNPQQETGATSGATSITPTQTEPSKIPAPDFTVYDLEGNEVHLSDFLGKPIVLNFWASWCGPCQMEMPDFQEAYLEFGDSIAFLMVNMTDGFRETVTVASEFIAVKGYTFPVFYDKATDAAATYGVYSLPTTYFIDADGYAIAQATGAINRSTLQRGIDLIMPQ